MKTATEILGTSVTVDLQVARIMKHIADAKRADRNPIVRLAGSVTDAVSSLVPGGSDGK